MIYSSFSEPEIITELMAKMLFEVQAVNFSPDKPYKLSSGIMSPVYIDCRKLISFVRIRSAIIDFAVTTILRNAGFECIDIIAGGETAGIPFAAFLAERLRLPMIYVRKNPKIHGSKEKIEGYMPKGARVLVIEDLTTLGGSMFNFINTIRDAGGIVEHGLSLFFYGIFPNVEACFKEKDIKLHYLITWNDIFKVAQKLKIFDKQTLYQTENFINNPMQWSAHNGGISCL
ncbi:Orotate phosphoribosyltransferase [Liberibacter crescens BT-1]|uniref:Orotate phosphoribosyltransferase n=1 Tax=Liberibacter crescens (strain BT-1) TaxID=1215343 RepID=L0EUK2_LIBCB|nr:orotate phosphoribosyltransferase [Liberibacter crescens]AGA64642.1 Orotate phosphoribosyltransferase [Liberibacter crescens BT-1]AMC12755.1 orotate phosphoribosyltransferase [Liberibacter crescens]